MKKKHKLKIFTTLFVLMIFSGCSLRPIEEEPKPGQPLISPTPKEGTIEITLYFSDDKLMEVIPEERQVEKDYNLEKLIVEQLLNGPNDETLRPVWPRGLNPLTVETIGGITYVNFPRDINYKFESELKSSLAVESLVKSLTELPGINAVQILIEGKKQHFLYGNVNILEPLYRQVKVGFIYNSSLRNQKLQQRIEKGKELWRLDPLEVAKRDGRIAGFKLTDDFKLKFKADQNLNSMVSTAVVEAVHQEKAYEIRLYQPLGSGEEKIWVIDSVVAKFTEIAPLKEDEQRITGHVMEIDKEKRIITIDREYKDELDGAKKVVPEIFVLPEAIVHIQEIIGKSENGKIKLKEIDAKFDDIDLGDKVSMVLTKDRKARALIIHAY